jgi:hypothetical protein
MNFIDDILHIASLGVYEAGGRPQVPRRGECRFDSHVWEQSMVDIPKGTAVRVVCKMCGTGHTLELKRTARGEIATDITVHTADGANTVSREVIQWSIFTREATIEEIRQRGEVVVRGNVTIEGEPR